MPRSVDYKETLLLPKTEFSMRADLARREPVWLARWENERAYEKLLAAREAAGAPKFILHDGPPYPTGGIHYGTVLNKVLKDIIVRSQLLMGRHARFVPGWDCHGLPIEQQVEKLTGSKASENPVEFRRKCEEHALKFVDVMRGEFKRLGCLGIWDKPYLTLTPHYEATIVRQLASFARQGLLYRAKRPVHWCTTHQTALAEAEVEYLEHASPSIYVRFPIAPGQEAVTRIFGKNPAALVIWTTTPWTIPANLAVVANPALEYVGLPVGGKGSGEFLIVAKGLAEAFVAATGLACAKEGWVEISGEQLRGLEGVRYQHPFVAAPRSDRDYRLWFAPHATLDAGTGLVHTAPGHGAEDYVVGREKGLDIYAPVDARGRYTAEVPAWTGVKVFEANPLVVAALAESGHLLNRPGELVRHQYPHCWRCRSPVIFRATSQWFASLGVHGDASSLREKALGEIDRTTWIPAWGRDRIRGMIEVRPDWCLSRQRVWGVPIPALRCGVCDESFLIPDAMEFVAKLFEAEGAGAWYKKTVEGLSPPGTRCPRCAGVALEKTSDIVDVWFESGVSWAAVAEGNLVAPDEKVDMYLEGADQHRGWFHSSLLTAVATRGHAPYKSVLTHGWVLDDKGRAYSKSDIAKARAAGAKIDYVDPIVWAEHNGAELLRLWAAAADYQADVVFSKTILDQLAESYRKIRNTCRFLLGNLHKFVPARDALPDDRLREVDLLAIGILRERDHQVFEAYRRYSFHDAVRLMVEYAVTASAEYLDGAKDTLYCDAGDSPTRRSAQTAVYEMVRTIATWMAPVLCFTAQDVADELHRTTGEPFDVHGQVRDEVSLPGKAMSQNPNRRWNDEIRPRRQAILQHLEAFRKAGHKSLEAKVVVRPAAAERPHWQWNAGHLAELCVVSQIEIAAEDAAGKTEISVVASPHAACPRCWRHIEHVHPELCDRCAEVISQLNQVPAS